MPGYRLLRPAARDFAHVASTFFSLCNPIRAFSRRFAARIPAYLRSSVKSAAKMIFDSHISFTIPKLQPKLWAYTAGIAANHGVRALAIGGLGWTSALFPLRMELKERGCRIAGSFGNFALRWSLGDPQQQADHQISPQQAGELLAKFSRIARQQS